MRSSSTTFNRMIGIQGRHKSLRLFLLGAVIVLSTKRVFCFNSISSPDGLDNNNNNNNNNSDDNEERNKSFGGAPAGKIPFVGPLNHEYQDPFAKGFEITTRVYTNPDDKLAHFDDDNFSNESDNTNNNKPVVLPYWECGVAGSTTVPVPLSSMTVRHLLGGSKPGSFESGCGRGETIGIGSRGIGAANNDDKHPRLVIPLTTIEIVLNSGQTRIFQPGDVVLLENCLTGGHILQGHEGHDMVVMLLTLPHAYHHSGKDNNSLSSIFEKNFWKQNPCNTGLASSGSDRGKNKFDLVSWTKSYRVRRRLGLGVVGAGISLALADFLGKVAPLKLALLAGGGLVATGGTYGIVKLGELALDELDYWNERRQLRLQDGSDVDDGSKKSTSSDDLEAAAFAGSLL